MKRLLKNEKGFSLLEVIIAIVVLALISAVSFSALSSITKGTTHVNVEQSGRSLASSQMEYIKRQAYDPTGSYETITIPSGYSIDVAVADITSRDGNIQKIMVTVTYQGKTLTILLV